MIPSAFVVLAKLPLTPHGKVDRRSLPAPDTSRGELEKEYIAPQTPNEQAVADAWREVMHVERVGLHDNFFELGGDSILSIQVVSRLAAKKLRSTPSQVFQYQTVAELARVLDMAAEVAAEQGEVIGPVKLTPIQRWFFAQPSPNPSHFNQSLLLESQQRLDWGHLEQAVSSVLAQHDALRMRAEQKDGQWQQHAGPVETAQVTRIDLSMLPPEEQAAAIESHSAKAQQSLDLQAGPLVRVVGFDLGEGRNQRLLLAIHHLVVDGVSWRILLEDLFTAYQQLSRGARVALLPKTTSYQRWAEQLEQYAQSPALAEDERYWRCAIEATVPVFPVDHSRGPNTVASAERLTQSFDVAQTAAMLKDIPAVSHTQIQELLVAALALAYRQWSGHNALQLDLEGHGREDLFPGVDLSRTVGWFTTIFPVALELQDSQQPEEAARAVKERLRNIPGRGLGYGVLRYLRGDDPAKRLTEGHASSLLFNYLGQLDQAWENNPLGLRPAREPRGEERCPESLRSHAVEINAFVNDRRLQVEWTYSRNLHRPETIGQLAAVFSQTVRTLITRLLTASTAQYLPSDFPLAALDRQRLDRIAGKQPRLEDIYPLAPMQQDFFEQLRRSAAPGFAVTQLGCRLVGELDEEAFLRVWQNILRRHPILRTSFDGEAHEEPLQVVAVDPAFEVDRRDWRNLPAEQIDSELASLRQTERTRGFDLQRSPLMRFVLARVADEAYQFLWSHSHILLDGWSISLILREVFLSYEAVQLAGIERSLPPSRPLRDYITWLGRQNSSQTEAFWRAHLAGISRPTPLCTATNEGTAAGLHPEQGLRLPRAETARLQSAARQHQLTLNTLVQAAWSRVLAQHSGQSQVVYGTVVSGRPADLPGADSMVGLLINVLPVRVDVPAQNELLPWLKSLQSQWAELRQHEHTPLAQVRRWCEVPEGIPLFDSLVAFENYPVASSLASTQGGSLQWDDVYAAEQWSYPLHVIVVPEQEMQIRMIYDRRRLDDAAVTRLLEALQSTLGELASLLT